MFYFYINHNYVKKKEDVFILTSDKSVRFSDELKAKGFNRFINDLSIFNESIHSKYKYKTIQSLNEVTEKLFLEYEFMFIENSLSKMKDFLKFSGKFDDILKIGVTGTNGKTSTVHYLCSLFTLHTKEKAVSVGTNGICLYKNGRFKVIFEIPNTMPNFEVIYYILDFCKKKRCKMLSMEVSSHGLVQDRLNDLVFDVSIFSNLTQDHLDYHKNIDEYCDAKSLLFSKYSNKKTLSVVNSDSEFCEKIIKNCKSEKILTYGYSEKSDYLISNLQFNNHKVEFTLSDDLINKYEVKTSLLGSFQAYNLSSALIALSYTLKVKLEYLNQNVRKIRNSEGRFDCIVRNEVIYCVDYAHTPDALENVLKSIRTSYVEFGSENKLITIFGCGGNRDSKKRPIMGSIAEKYSDLIFITDDNPRKEDPFNIVKDILEGINELKKVANFKLKRDESIIAASKIAKKGDFILIAGKGNEPYQIFGETKIPYSDYDVVNSIE